MTFRIALLLAAAASFQSAAHAQTAPAAVAATPPAAAAADNKQALAAKLVALQRGPEMERMVFQLTSSVVQPAIQRWAQKLETLPAAKQEKARDQLNAELKAHGDSVRKLIEDQMAKSADSMLQTAYLERFSESEMTQLVALFESPAFKKYQTMAPELGDLWIKDVISNSRAAVLDKDKAFDAKATSIFGAEPAEKKPAPKKK
jgi:hypothetical protein